MSRVPTITLIARCIYVVCALGILGCLVYAANPDNTDDPTRLLLEELLPWIVLPFCFASLFCGFLFRSGVKRVSRGNRSETQDRARD